MDKLNNKTINALQWVIDCAEGVTCNITQDLEKEELIIVNEFGQKTVMNCRFNSVGATIRQICKHINNKTLFSYEEDYTMNAKLDYNQIMVDASNRLHAIINACINKDNDSIVRNTIDAMYSSEKYIPVVKEERECPVLDQDLCFKYKGYSFELSSCNNIVNKNQIIGLTDENFRERFPHGVFTDRYVCWMQGHKDYDGHTKDDVDDPENWAAKVYLVPGVWSWGADSDLNPGNVVDPIILETIDKFLETFKE